MKYSEREILKQYSPFLAQRHMCVVECCKFMKMDVLLVQYNVLFNDTFLVKWFFRCDNASIFGKMRQPNLLIRTFNIYKQ